MPNIVTNQIKFARIFKKKNKKKIKMKSFTIYCIVLLHIILVPSSIVSFTPLIDIDKNSGPERSVDVYTHLVNKATVDNPLIIYFYKPDCHQCEDFEHILSALASEKTPSMQRFTFAKAIGDASRSFPIGNPHSYTFLHKLNIHKFPSVRFFPQNEKVECMHDLDAIKNALFKMNMLGKTFPPILKANQHEPTPYHYSQKLLLTSAIPIATKRALSSRREVASSHHIETNSFIQTYVHTQTRMNAFIELFKYPVRGGQCHSSK